MVFPWNTTKFDQQKQSFSLHIKSNNFCEIPNDCHREAGIFKQVKTLIWLTHPNAWSGSATGFDQVSAADATVSTASLIFNHPLCWRVSHSVTHKHELWIWFTLSYAMMKALLRLAAVRDTKQAGELRGDTVHFIASSSKQQHLSTIKTDGDLSFTIIQQQTYRRKQLMDQADDNSLTALLTKKNPSTVPRDRKYTHRKASRKTHSTNGMNIESRVT